MPGSKRRTVVLGVFASLLALLLLREVATRSVRSARSGNAGRQGEVLIPPPPSDVQHDGVRVTPPRVQLRVLDLWDDSSIADVTIKVSLDLPQGAGDVSWTSDENGCILVAEEELSHAVRLESRDDDHVVASMADDVRDRKEIYCYRRSLVSGRVVFNGGTPDQEFDCVELSYSLRWVDEDETSTTAPGRAGWVRQNREFPARLGSPGEDGTFSLQLPRIRRAGITARAPGWCAAWAELDEALASPSREVLLELRHAFRVTGVLVDERGAPLSGQKIQVYVIRRSRFTGLETAEVGRLKSGGFALKRSRKDDSAVHNLQYSARTDEAGKWGVDLDADGEVIVTTYIPGRVPVAIEAGIASRTGGRELALTAGVTTAQRVRVVKGGEPLSLANTIWVDLTLIDAQPMFQLRSDEDGWVESTWLVPGRRYALIAVTEPPAYLELAGEVIDIERCERDVGRFLANR